MYEKIKQWYKKGLWTKEQVLNAAENPPSKPLLTNEEAQDIISEEKI